MWIHWSLLSSHTHCLLSLEYDQCKYWKPGSFSVYSLDPVQLPMFTTSTKSFMYLGYFSTYQNTGNDNKLSNKTKFQPIKFIQGFTFVPKWRGCFIIFSSSSTENYSYEWHQTRNHATANYLIICCFIQFSSVLFRWHEITSTFVSRRSYNNKMTPY